MMKCRHAREMPHQEPRDNFEMVLLIAYHGRYTIF